MASYTVTALNLNWLLAAPFNGFEMACRTGRLSEVICRLAGSGPVSLRSLHEYPDLQANGIRPSALHLVLVDQYEGLSSRNELVYSSCDTIRILKLLLAYPAVRRTVDYEYHDGGTVLHMATCSLSAPELVYELLHAGADPLATNRFGLAPLLFLQKIYTLSPESGTRKWYFDSHRALAHGVRALPGKRARKRTRPTISFLRHESNSPYSLHVHSETFGRLAS